MFKKLLFVLFLLSTCFINAQYEFIIHKNIWDRNIAFDSISQTVLKYNNEQLNYELDKIRNLAKENNDEVLKLETELVWVSYHIYHKTLNQEKIINKLEEIILLSKRSEIIDIEERARIILANYYWKIVQNYELAFENYLKADQLLQQLNPKSFPLWTKHYSKIAMAFYDFRDYESAINYLKKGNKAPINKYTWKNRWSSSNNLGLCYLKIEKVDSAMYFFNKSIQSSFIPKDGLRYSISMGNIGYIFYKNKNYDVALPLLINDMNNGDKFKDFGVAAGAAIPLADIYIERDSLHRAEEYLKKARAYIVYSGQEQRFIDYYKIAEKLNFKQKKYEIAKQYQDSFFNSQTVVHSKYDALLLMRGQQRFDKQALEIELEKNKLNERIKFIQNLVYLTIILAVLIIGLLILLYYRKKNRIISKRKDEEIKNAKIQLKNLTKNMAEKNLLINKFQNLNNGRDKAKIIDDLQKTNILTQEDWIDFKKKFETIYPEFFRKIINIKSITSSEVRLLCLSKLNLSSTEIAAIIGVSPQSTRITWYRFKNKHNLSKECTINDYLKKMDVKRDV